jgi:adenylate cyclase
MAVEQAERSLRLSPFDPLSYLPYVGLAYAHFFASRFAESAAAASRASQANPQFSVPYLLQTAALGSLGRTDEARGMAHRLIEHQPNFTVGSVVSSSITSAERLAALGEALRRAGLAD